MDSTASQERAMETGNDTYPSRDDHKPEKYTDSEKIGDLPLSDNTSYNGPSSRSNSSIDPVEKAYPETDLARGIIGWDGQNDPANPQNFSPARKWTLLALVSAISLISPLASSMFSPAVGYMGADFGIMNETLLSFSVTIFLLGYTFGPLLLAPLSEIYGRRVVLSAANWFFVVWQIGCALAPNIESLVVMRFLAGIGGCGCLTLGAGVIADLFPREKRGMATSVWSMGPLIGPVVGPICGGFVGQELGWRWIFWILLIFSGAVSLGIECFNQETYAPVLMRWKTERLMKELNRDDLHSAYSLEGQGKNSLSLRDVLHQGMRRPFLLLFRSPIVLLLSTYMAVVYGLLYLFFTTITTVFERKYGFSTGIAGLAFLGIGVGFFIGLILVASTSDKVVIKLTAQNNGQFEPEMRLPTMIFFSCLLPISFFWYGWSADKKTHWIVPIIGMAPFGIGMMGVYMASQIYCIDNYPAYAASANAALTASRSLVGAVLPLAGPKLFDNLGLGWGNSLLGFIALAFVPVPLFFHRYGGMIRKKFPVNLG